MIDNDVNDFMTSAALRGAGRGDAAPGPAVFGGQQLAGVENFYVLL